MSGIAPARLKRKEIDGAYDEFTDFTLSSPATKIRRLDAVLAPIVEEEDPAPSVFSNDVDAGMMGVEDPAPVVVDDVNDEKALVLYRPVSDRLMGSPGLANVSYRVSSDVISGLKNQYFWPSNPTNGLGAERPAVNNCLALVPFQQPVHASVDPPLEEEDLMDADVATMEVEENCGETFSAGVGGDSLHQWPQHCMSPQLSPNTNTPVMWS